MIEEAAIQYSLRLMKALTFVFSGVFQSSYKTDQLFSSSCGLSFFFGLKKGGNLKDREITVFDENIDLLNLDLKRIIKVKIEIIYGRE